MQTAVRFAPEVPMIVAPSFESDDYYEYNSYQYTIVYGSSYGDIVVADKINDINVFVQKYNTYGTNRVTIYDLSNWNPIVLDAIDFTGDITDFAVEMLNNYLSSRNN